MDERLRESISALMDDEANELELQRVLSNVDDDLATVWNRYHQVRQVVRECDRDVMNIDIRASLSLALDESVADKEPFSSENASAGTVAPSSGATKRFSLARSFAIAASIAVAVVVGVQYQSVGTNELPLLADADSEPLSTGDVLPEVALKEPKIYVEFDERHARRFNEYLLRHAEHSAFGSSQGIMPLARVASVNSVGI
jgi:sigma-E factor negative regulatory protein RseA